jgi:hypothetical protein
MVQTFESISLKLNGRSGYPDKQTAILAVRLESEETPNHFPLVEIEALVDKGPSATLGGLEEQARVAALTTLREVMRLLEQHSVAELAQREIQQDVEREHRQEEAFRSSISAALNQKDA